MKILRSEALAASGAEMSNVSAVSEAPLGYILVPDHDADWFRQMLPAAVAVVPLAQPAASGQQSRKSSVEPIAYPFLGFAARSDEGMKQAAKDEASIEKRFGNPLLEAVLLDDEATAPAKLQHWVAQAFAKLVQTARIDAAQQRMALAALRRDYVEMETAFKGVEDYMISQHLPPLWLAFDLAPGIGWVSHGAARGEVVIEQLLPVSARGIVAVELHIAYLHEHSAGKLEIAIHASDNPSAGHAWTIDYAALKNGWNMFQFMHANAMPNVSARLVVKLQTQSGSPPAISIGEVMAPEKFRPFGVTGQWSTSALAFRVWKGVPGVKVPRFHGAVTLEAGEQQYGLIISPSEMKTAALLFAPMPEKLEGINYWQKESAVLVHPRAGGVTCAYIKAVEVEDLVAVRAIVNLANAKAKPVEFAVTAISSGTYNPDNMDDLFPHWTTAKALSWTEVFSPLDVTLDGPVDILLATKMDRNEKPDLAWALFRRIELIRTRDTDKRPGAAIEDAAGA